MLTRFLYWVINTLHPLPDGPLKPERYIKAFGMIGTRGKLYIGERSILASRVRVQHVGTVDDAGNLSHRYPFYWDSIVCVIGLRRHFAKYTVVSRWKKHELYKLYLPEKVYRYIMSGIYND